MTDAPLLPRVRAPSPGAAHAHRLADLPEHRRDALLWHYAWELDYAGVEELVREQSRTVCWSPRRATANHAGALVAVLGDDGRYHLRHGDARPLCADPRARRRDPPGVVQHEQHCYWWSDRTLYRIQAPPDAHNPDGHLIRGRSRLRTVKWLVRLTGEPADPALVRARHRCPIFARWPGFQDPATRIGRIRATLAAALGPDCHACRDSPGSFVDHDHFTGLVRGLLCHDCNSHIDTCPHARACWYADYLNDPPAGSLRLIYPKPGKIRPGSTDELRAAVLGFNPLYRDGTT